MSAALSGGFGMKKHVMSASKLYRKLPEIETSLDEERSKKRARARRTQQQTNFSSDSPFKRKCVVDSDTTDSE